MKNIIYQVQLWALLLILPLAGQEKSESELASEKVHSFIYKENNIPSISFFERAEGRVPDVTTIAKIDAFVASMKTDAEKIAVMSLFRMGYGYSKTTQEHAERLIKKFLSDKESLSVRAEAVSIVVGRGLNNLEPEALNVFREDGHSKRTRERLIWWLSSMGVDSLIEIRPYLDSEDKELRTAALEAFARMAPRMTLDRNLTLLTHVDAHEREAAVERLAENGERVAHHLHKLLDDPSDRVRGEAIEVLGTISHKKHLMDLLFKKLEKMDNDESVSVRREVLSIIVERFKEKSNPFILEALKDKSEYIIEDALVYLTSSTIPHEKQIELASPFLKHPEDGVRLKAVRVLSFRIAGMQNDGLKEDIPHKKNLMNALFKKLEKMSNDDSVAVRKQVHSVITRQFKEKSNPFILEALKDENRSVIQEALSHLRSSTIPDEKRIELIMPFLKHQANEVRAEAVNALGSISHEEYLTNDLFKRLEQMSTDESVTLRCAVLYVISNKYKAKANPFILAALKDKSESVVQRALQHLSASTIPDEKKIELITPFLKHYNMSIRGFAQQSVERLQKKQPDTK